MIGPLTFTRVFLAAGITDMRKSINGLSLLVEQAMGLSPFDGDLFVFCNRQRNGFALWHKRLEKHRFKWPAAEQEVVNIEPKQLEWLLAGLDYAHAHERLKYLYAS